MKIETTIGIYADPEMDSAILKDSAGNLRFRVDATGPEGIFCDATGERPGSVIFGIGLIPVVECPGSGDGTAAWQTATCDACQQAVPVVAVPGKLGDSHYLADHEANQLVIDNYELNPQQGAIWFDATRAEIEALQAQLQRVIDDNDWADLEKQAVPA